MLKGKLFKKWNKWVCGGILLVAIGFLFGLGAFYLYNSNYTKKEMYPIQKEIKENPHLTTNDTYLDWHVKESNGEISRKTSLFDIKDEYRDQVHFYNLDEIVDMLINKKMSLSRFGDGELDLVRGLEMAPLIRFQKFSPKLQQRLKEVLYSQDSRIGIGIPIKVFTKNKSRLWVESEKEYAKILSHFINKDQVYFPTEMTTRNIRSEWWFNKIRQVWNNRNVHLIHGKGIFDGFQYDIFDNAKSVTHQIAPNRNAFEEYDAILKEALKTNKDDLIIIVLGPTATVLAYDLAKQGYQALDLGHIAKNYDWYKRGKKGKNGFYHPDGPEEKIRER